MRVILKAEMDSEITGELGWTINKTRNCQLFQPITYAYGLAHDILEHFAFDSLADEIMAHGAMYRIRYETGWTNKYGQSLSIANLAHAWAGLFQGVFSDGLEMPSTARKLDDCIEKDIEQIIAQGTVIVLEENTGEHVGEDLSMLRERFADWFRIGYRKASKRYRKHDVYQVGYMFTQLANRLEKLTPDFEGQTVSVHVDISGGKIVISEKITEHEYA